MPTLSEVFGISTKPIRSYTERSQVDGKFVEAIQDDRHIVIYGSSKQGKTSLRNKHISDKKCLVIRCSPKTSTETIYQAILRDTEIKIEAIETVTDVVKGGAKGKWGFKAVLPFLGGADAEGEVSAEASRQKELQYNFIGFDFGDAQSITEIIKKVNYNKFIILENFHYLPEITQKQIAFDLKSFHEVGLRFIVLGIWREANYLLLYNGDLQDRISEIPVEPWEDDDFDMVIANGSQVLNVEIDVNILREFKNNAYGNIGMLQEFLKTYCKLNEIKDTQSELKILDDPYKVDIAFSEKLQDQMGRLIKVLQSIAGSSRTDTEDPLILPYYLVRVILTCPIAELLEGIRRRDLLEKLRSMHHREAKDTVRMSDLSNLIKRLPTLQENVQPPFLHYDPEQKRVKIVDATQFFVLARIDRDDVLQEISDPLQEYN